jgi:hypothetical protein
LSKFGNRKIVVDGILFDSIAESKYYKKLKLLEAKGMIRAVETQPIFLLQEGFEKNGAKYKPITYIADFRYIDKEGNVCIVDVKTKATETDVFRIKHKLFEKRYPDLHLHVEYVDKGADSDGNKGKGTTKKKKAKPRGKNKATYRKSK